VVRRARRDALSGIASALDEQTRTQSQTTFALTIARTEAGIALERFDVAVPELDRTLELVKRHVFAAAD
jgi:hypothetical protein